MRNKNKFITNKLILFLTTGALLYVSAIIISHLQKQLILNLSKPTGYVIHQQFNIQQLYALTTLYLCVLCLSENKQRLVPLTV